MDIQLETLQDGGVGFHPLVYWYISLRCNLSCRHCWVRSSPSCDVSADLTLEQALFAVDEIASVSPSMVILSGGEPLLRPDFQDIIRSLVGHGLSFSVETNAVLLKDSDVELFAEAVKKGLRCWISVSLDGGNRDTHERIRGRGTFDRVLSGIGKLRQSGIPHGVQMVVNRINLRSIPDMFRLAQSLGIDAGSNILAFGITSPIGRGADSASELVPSLHEYFEAYQMILAGLKTYQGRVSVKVPPAAIPIAYLGQLMHNPKVNFHTSCAFPSIGVLPDGTLSVCALTGLDGSLVLGRLLEDDLSEIVAHKLLPLFEAYRFEQLTGVCAECAFKEACKGSCRAIAYSTNGSFNGPHPLCDDLNRAGLLPNAYRKAAGRPLPVVNGRSLPEGTTP